MSHLHGRQCRSDQFHQLDPARTLGLAPGTHLDKATTVALLVRLLFCRSLAATVQRLGREQAQVLGREVERRCVDCCFGRVR